MSVQPGQHDAQLFWLALLGAVRAATGRAESPPAAPGFNVFSGLLRLELRRTLPGDIPELHRLAARWFAEHAEIAEAIRHQEAAGDWTEAARLLTDHALSLTLDGQDRAGAGHPRRSRRPAGHRW